MTTENRHHPKARKQAIVEHYTEELKKVVREQIKKGKHKKHGFFKKTYLSHIPLTKTDRTGEGTAVFLFHFAVSEQPDTLVLDSFTLHLPQGSKVTGSTH